MWDKRKQLESAMETRQSSIQYQVSTFVNEGFKARQLMHDF
jgi:hypothetical protein